MKKTLENFEGKTVQFKNKSNRRSSLKNYRIGLVRKRKHFKSIFVISTEYYICSEYSIDMRTVKELTEEEIIIWKLEHNM